MQLQTTERTGPQVQKFVVKITVSVK